MTPTKAPVHCVECGKVIDARTRHAAARPDGGWAHCRCTESTVGAEMRMQDEAGRIPARTSFADGTYGLDGPLDEYEIPLF